MSRSVENAIDTRIEELKQYAPLARQYIISLRIRFYTWDEILEELDLLYQASKRFEKTYTIASQTENKNIGTILNLISNELPQTEYRSVFAAKRYREFRTQYLKDTIARY